MTGVTGFVGRSLVRRLLTDGLQVRGIARHAASTPALPIEMIRVGAINGVTDWCHVLNGVDVVVHLAARTHAVHERGRGNLAEYRQVNVDGTRRLAEAAVRSGVRRFVFVSSIKVNGERTPNGPFGAGDPPAPQDAYGISKWEAEQVLADVAGTAGLEWVVVRPPLVYGAGAKGNFARLCEAVRRRYVLPFEGVDNRRSLVALDNLVDLLARCASHPSAPGGTFLVSDGEDISTPELVRRIARAMGIQARLVDVPPRLLSMAARLTGRKTEADRLLGSLQVDIEHTRRTLDWVPPVTVDEGLQRAVSSA